MHVDEQQHEAARGADAGGADPEGDGVEPLHVEPDDLGADLIVGAGADRLAGTGEAEERPEQGGAHHRAAGGEAPGPCRAAAADVVGI